MKLSDADAIVLELWNKLLPHCCNLSVAGSVRRRKSEVKDIELVVIAKPYESGLFEDGLAEVVNQWKKVKGEMEYGKVKYTQRILPQGIKLDLFFATPENFGYILMLRTGSSDWNQRVMLTRLKGNGYRTHEGSIWHKGLVWKVPDEETMFRCLGLEFVEPQNRI